MRAVCILDLDSPSYPPEIDEYHQCGCQNCLNYLASICECHINKEACPAHGIAASNARQNRYWQRVGGHD